MVIRYVLKSYGYKITFQDFCFELFFLKTIRFFALNFLQIFKYKLSFFDLYVKIGYYSNAVGFSESREKCLKIQNRKLRLKMFYLKSLKDRNFKFSDKPKLAEKSANKKICCIIITYYYIFNCYAHKLQFH